MSGRPRDRADIGHPTSTPLTTHAKTQSTCRIFRKTRTTT